MRHLAITGMDTAAWISRILTGSAMRAIPPWARMSAGTRSSAMTATAPASSAIFAWSAFVTSMITPPLSISARPTFSRNWASLSSLFSFGVNIRPPAPRPHRLQLPVRHAPPRGSRLARSQALGQIGQRERVESGQHALVERAPQGMGHAVLLVAVRVLETLDRKQRAFEQRHHLADRDRLGILRQDDSATGAATRAYQPATPKLGQELLEVLGRQPLGLGHGANVDRSFSVARCQIGKGAHSVLASATNTHFRLPRVEPTRSELRALSRPR